MSAQDALIRLAESGTTARRRATVTANRELADPSASPQIQTSGGAIDRSIGGLIDDIEAGGDALQISLRRSLIESRLGQSLRIPGFRLPTRQQLELQDIQGQTLLMKRRKELDGLIVEDTFGRLMDAKEALGIDASIRDDPDNFVAAVQRGIQAGVLPEGLQISHSTLANAGLESALMSPQARTGKLLGTTVSNIERAGEVRETIGAAAGGEGALGQALDAQIQAGEEISGRNLGTGVATDVDERLGAKELLNTYLRFREEQKALVGPRVLGGAVLDRYADVIKDQLEGLQKDGEGKLLFGKGSGDAGVDDEAVLFLSTLLGFIGADTGQEIGDVMQSIGLDYTGINDETFRAAQAAAQADLAADSG